MFSAKHPCCSYPTEVVFVDNNPTFLETLESLLESRKKDVVFKYFSDPKAALQYINDAPSETFVDRFAKRAGALQVERQDIRFLYEEMYHSDKFKQISVVVISSELDKTSGLGFCNQISRKDIQKTILTTKLESSPEIAEAISQGVIKCSISKPQLASINDLLMMLKNTQCGYFFQLSQTIYETVEEYERFPLAICHTAFSTFFEKFLKKHNIIEYYLFDFVGSAILVNEKGEIKLLFVQNLDQHEATLLEVEDEIGQSISMSLGDKIKAGESIFCYPNLKNEKMPRVSEWHKYFHTAMSIVDEHNKTFFYCAFVDEFSFPDLHKVTTFDRYRKMPH